MTEITVMNENGDERQREKERERGRGSEEKKDMRERMSGVRERRGTRKDKKRGADYRAQGTGQQGREWTRGRRRKR